jgi:hypothetical protein
MLVPSGINHFGNSMEGKNLTLDGWGAHDEFLLADLAGVQDNGSVKQKILY